MIFTLDTHYEDYLETFEGKNLPVSHCIRGTKGWDIIPELVSIAPISAHKVYKNTFGYSGWNFLRGDIEFHVCGLCTDICVVSNVLALRMFFPNSCIIVDSDCCAGTSEKAHEAALEVMKSCQVEIE